MERHWFQHKQCTSLEIKKLQSLANHEVVKAVVINDFESIQLLMQRIEQIPAGGEMMKSFAGTAEHIQLLFHGEQGTQTIDIIQKAFKTPSTGFNMRHEMETGLYQDIDALLFPGFNKNLLKVPQLEFQFPNFHIMYTGHEFYDAAPATVQIHTDHFILRRNDNNIQTLDIRSGQVSPQPLLLHIDDVEIKLLTFATSDGNRLYPNYFRIETPH